MDTLSRLESRSIHIIREAYAAYPSLGFLWSIGKDSTVLLWLVRKAFFGHVPLPVIHVDTTFKIASMVEFRDRLAREWGFTLVTSQNEEPLRSGETFPAGKVDRLRCCHLLKTEGLRQMLSGDFPRFRLDLATGRHVPYDNRQPFTAVMLGVRSDEEGTRSKERVFSPRDPQSRWNVAAQPPEFWNQYQTELPPGAHVRIHPLLDWTELNVWEYIQREGIPVIPLYFDQGAGTRYRSIGCGPCTFPVKSPSRNVAEIIAELRDGALSRVAERAGRAQDQDGGGTLEALRRDGYM
jgi:sulfate adenylyltransferase subunit 2